MPVAIWTGVRAVTAIALSMPYPQHHRLVSHRAIFEAIAAGDPALSAERMLAHLVGTTDDLLKIAGK